MFGESVFALIPDHGVRAAKLTNRWISGCWWGRDASSDEHLVGRNMVCKNADQFAENLLESSGADVKRSTLEGRNGVLMWKWTLKYLEHVQMKQRHRKRFPQYLRLHLCQKSTFLKCEVKECTRKHSGSELSGQKSEELLDAWHVRRPVRGSHTHTRECKSCQDAWDESLRTAPAEEAKRGIARDPDTRPLDPSGSSVDPEPKRTKTTSVTDNENLANRMKEDNFRRGPATSHQLEPVDDGNLSKKARVAKNVLHIRGEDNVKFDVTEEAWPNADLDIRASYEGALIDGLPADKVKAGDEREIQQMKDLQLYSIHPDKSILLTGWARRMKGSDDDCEYFAPTPSPL